MDDRISKAERDHESVDIQSSFLDVEGFWPTIPRLASVQDAFPRRGGSIYDAVAGDINSYSIADICGGEDNPNFEEPVTQFLPGFSSLNLNTLNSAPGNYSQSTEKKNQGTENKSTLNAADDAIFQPTDYNHVLEDPEIATSRDFSISCSKTSIEELPWSLQKDENKRVHRAPSKRVANIALKDLAKYFDLPITEASRRLKVGLTVLKRKCREFGIPRWPHRKIKSLNSLIHNLQEEAKRQEREDQVAARAVIKRTRILETERQKIERKPGTDLQRDTKRFRQDIFKRRHRANALKKKYESSDTNSEDGNSPVSTILTLMIDQSSTSPPTS